MKKQFLNAVILGLLFTLVFQSFFNKKTDEQQLAVENEGLILELNDDSFVIGRESKAINVNVKNTFSDKDLIILSCDDEILFEVITGSQKVNETLPCDIEVAKKTEIKSGTELNFDLLPYSHELFKEEANYSIVAYFKTADSEVVDYSNVNVEIKEPNVITNLWRIAVYKPIYNFLVLLAYYVPGQSVGLAIILLTIVVKTILLVPTMKGMKSQQLMQEMQPKIQSIQEKYKGNQAKIAEETLKIWKEHKVNPFSSCLPILLQAPILIGVFYAIKSGFSFNHEYLIYSSLTHIDILSLDINFMNILDLTKPNKFVLPFIVGVLQYIQIKMSMPKKDDTKKKESSSEMEQSMKMMQGSMLYMLPIMVAFFSASFPSGISLYWASSTLYGIAQQFYINSKKKK